MQILTRRLKWLNTQIGRAVLPEATLQFKRSEAGALEVALDAVQQNRVVGMSSILKVTSGGPLGSFYHVTTPTMRCEIGTSTPNIVTLDWAYFGTTAEPGLLDSGILRRQIGLKLRAANPCNLLYVMREVDPEPRIFVQVKSNPGKRTSEECGSEGYVTLGAAKVPSRVLSKLQVKFVGDLLDVYEGGVQVLSVDLSQIKLPKGGYGVRSDSGRFVFKLTA